MLYRNYLRCCLALVCLAAAFIQLSARPALNRPLTITQPDGSRLTLVLHGDEFCHYYTTSDGYTIVKGTDGLYRYAQKDADGQLVASALVATDSEQRTPEVHAFLANVSKRMRPQMSPERQQLRDDAARLYGADLMGNNPAAAQHRRAAQRFDYSKFKGLVLLVEFTDRKFLREDANSFYGDLTSTKNLDGYYDTDGETVIPIDGSVRDYFYTNSMGAFDPTFDVRGPVTINYKSTDAKGNDNILPLLRAALAAANDEVNYADYDLDGNGYVDMVYFIFAGYGSYVNGNNEDYVWPHASDLTNYSRYYSLRYDNKYFSRYACSVEIQDYEANANVRQTLDGIGTMCHEFSHVLGLADHYDTDYEENGQYDHPGLWDVMAGGADYNNGFTPCGYNAYERVSLGFAPLTDLTVAGNYELESFDVSNQSFRLKTGTPNEVFYMENRQKQGWDRFLPGSGLLVWRVDSTKSSVWTYNSVNCDPTHPYYELLKATPGKNYYSAYIPFPGQGNNTDLTDTSSPALLSWKGQPADLFLYDIQETADGKITFTAGKGLYETKVEDFESMALTTADAADQQGVFCQWDLQKATIETPDADKGFGNRMVKMLRSSTLTSSVLSRSVRTVKLTAWTGSQQVKVGLRYKTADGNWTYVLNSSNQQQTTLKRNSGETVVDFRQAIPAGAQLQIEVLGTSNSAVCYVDDVTITFGTEEASAIRTVLADGDRNAPAYNLKGQKVDDNYRGLVVRGGKKWVK